MIDWNQVLIEASIAAMQGIATEVDKPYRKI